MVVGIAFYALYKSRVLLIPCKADDLFIYRGTRWNLKKVALSNLELNFFIVLWSNLKETLHY